MATRRRIARTEQILRLPVRPMKYPPSEGMSTDVELRERLAKLDDPEETQRFLDAMNKGFDPPIYTMEDVERSNASVRASVEYELLPGNHIVTEPSEED